jgi:hexosaminidase
MKQKTLLITLLLFVLCQWALSSTFGIIPKPVYENYPGDNVLIPRELTINGSLNDDARELLIETLRNDLKIKVSFGNDQNSFIRFVSDNSLPEEAYELRIDSGRIDIISSSSAGTLWAVQTLRQLLRQSFLAFAGQPKQLPVAVIKDEPSYYWRGFHLDVSRHFFDKAYLKKLIEWLSYYKISKFQIHLTDDQGWRIEIDRYPLLTEIGAWRTLDRWDTICIQRADYNAEMIPDERFMKNDSVYGGFYTKADMREIIAHASKYGVEIIPEIDMPGHMSSAIRAYPFLSCPGDIGWGTEFSYPICPCKPEVIEFAKNIYAEIAELFPSPYIHIGADEVEKGTWDDSPLCQQMMKEKNMESSVELETYFVNEMQQFLESKGKKVMVWDDATEGQVSNNLTVTYWRDWQRETLHSIKARGFPLIFTEWGNFYLSARPSFERLHRIYNYDMQQARFPLNKDDIIGYQACVWTETIPTEAKLEEHIFPALQAFCELVWSNERSWDDFLTRMKVHERNMDWERIRYRKYDFNQSVVPTRRNN